MAKSSQNSNSQMAYETQNLVYFLHHKKPSAHYSYNCIKTPRKQGVDFRKFDIIPYNLLLCYTFFLI